MSALAATADPEHWDYSEAALASACTDAIRLAGRVAT